VFADPEASARRRELAKLVSDPDFDPVGLAHDLEIEGLYGVLAELSREVTSPEGERMYQATLRRLRILEHAEADRMRAYFERHKALDEDAAERALERADELIRRHENPPTGDAAS
jgi:hypothetical protein